MAEPGTRCEIKNNLSVLASILAVRGPMSGTYGAGGACIGGGGSSAGGIGSAAAADWDWVVVNTSISAQREWSAKTVSYSPSSHSKHSAFNSAKDGNLIWSSAEGMAGWEDALCGCMGSNHFNPAFI